MKLLKPALALSVLALGTEAGATSFAWCEVKGGDNATHFSGIIEIEDGSTALSAFREGPFGNGFKDYVQSSTGYSSQLDCHSEDSLREANDRIEGIIYANSDRYTFRRTDWLGGRPAAVERDQPKQQFRQGDLIVTMPGQGAQSAPKRTNSAVAKQQWEIDYERKMAIYNQELAKQRQAVADYERAKAETEKKRAELAAQARQARADWERRVAACKGGDYSACSGATEQQAPATARCLECLPWSLTAAAGEKTRNDIARFRPN